MKQFWVEDCQEDIYPKYQVGARDVSKMAVKSL